MVTRYEWKATADKNRSRGIKQTSISSYACLLSQSLSRSSPPPPTRTLFSSSPTPFSCQLPPSHSSSFARLLLKHSGGISVAAGDPLFFQLSLLSLIYALKKLGGGKAGLYREYKEEEERRTNQVPNPDTTRFLEATAEIITSPPNSLQGTTTSPTKP